MPKSSPPGPWLSLTSDGFVLLVGFLLGLFAALTVRFWQSRIDEHSQRYDELRNAILQAAELSTDYWLKIRGLDDRQAETRLVGFFRLLNGLAVDLARATSDCPRIHAQRLVRFNDLITAGPRTMRSISARSMHPAPWRSSKRQRTLSSTSRNTGGGG